MKFHHPFGFASCLWAWCTYSDGEAAAFTRGLSQLEHSGEWRLPRKQVPRQKPRLRPNHGVNCPDLHCHLLHSLALRVGISASDCVGFAIGIALVSLGHGLGPQGMVTTKLKLSQAGWIQTVLIVVPYSGNSAFEGYSQHFVRIILFVSPGRCLVSSHIYHI